MSQETLCPTLVLICSRSSTSEQPVPAIGGFEPVQRSRSGSLNERKAGGQGSGSGIGAIGRTSGNNAGDSGHLQLQDELVDSADDFLNQYSQGECYLVQALATL